MQGLAARTLARAEQRYRLRFNRLKRIEDMIRHLDDELQDIRFQPCSESLGVHFGWDMGSQGFLTSHVDKLLIKGRMAAWNPPHNSCTLTLGWRDAEGFCNMSRILQQDVLDDDGLATDDIANQVNSLAGFDTDSFVPPGRVPNQPAPWTSDKYFFILAQAFMLSLFTAISNQQAARNGWRSNRLPSMSGSLWSRGTARKIIEPYWYDPRKFGGAW